MPLIDHVPWSGVQPDENEADDFSRTPVPLVSHDVVGTCSICEQVLEDDMMQTFRFPVSPVLGLDLTLGNMGDEGWACSFFV